MHGWLYAAHNERRPRPATIAALVDILCTCSVLPNIIIGVHNYFSSRHFSSSKVKISTRLIGFAVVHSYPCVISFKLSINMLFSKCSIESIRPREWRKRFVRHSKSTEECWNVQHRQTVALMADKHLYYLWVFGFLPQTMRLQSHRFLCSHFRHSIYINRPANWQKIRAQPNKCDLLFKRSNSIMTGISTNNIHLDAKQFRYKFKTHAEHRDNENVHHRN